MFKRFVAVIITVVLLFAVSTFAYANEKAEVESLKEKLALCIGRLASEYNVTIRSLQTELLITPAKLQPAAPVALPANKEKKK